METTPYILKEFKAFTLETSISDIKSFFEETTFSHFPVVEMDTFLGMISEADIEGIDSYNATLNDYQYLLHHFSIKEHNNILAVLELFAINNTNIIGVINNKKEYLGYYDLIDVLHTFNSTTFFKSEGEILLIEKAAKEYSTSEVCQIIESNKGAVLGIYINENDGVTARLTVKFSSNDVNEIIQSLRRYDYTILTNHEEDFLLEDLKNRSDYLQKYLDI
jgi:CBS domain-containing protein